MSDDVQVAVVHERPESSDFGSKIIEMGGGEGNVVELIAVHWHIELVNGAIMWQSLALSSNPEHLLTPPADIASNQLDVALYGRAVWIGRTDAVGESWVAGTIVVPLYGIIRPRKQIMVWGIIASTSVVGLTGEIYYRPVVLAQRDRDSINRKYGKYRRS